MYIHYIEDSVQSIDAGDKTNRIKESVKNHDGVFG